VNTPWRPQAFPGLIGEMKEYQKNLLRLSLAVLFITAGAARTLAYDHDDKGWIDSQHHHHPFVQHSGHRGYWDHDKSGAKVFINI
jgi:hypothetical protein